MPLPPLIDTFGPGALYGFTSVALGYPLDTIKTRMQTQRVASKRGILRATFDVLRGEGFVALYRGAWTTVPVHGAKRSMQFLVFETLLANNKKLNSFACGAVAGVSGSIVGCPLHVMKSQLQNTSQHELQNTVVCAKTIYRTEGLRGFYRGLHVQVVRDACFAGCFLGSYGQLRDQKAVAIPQAAAPFVNGMAASLLTWFLCFPLDTMKTCVQCRMAPGAMWKEIRDVPRRLWKGLMPTLLRAGPVSGLSMAAYEMARGHVRVASNVG